MKIQTQPNPASILRIVDNLVNTSIFKSHVVTSEVKGIHFNGFEACVFKQACEFDCLCNLNYFQDIQYRKHMLNMLALVSTCALKRLACSSF